LAFKIEDIINRFRVPPGKKIRLSRFDPAWMGTKEMRELGAEELKSRAKKLLQKNVEELAEAQELLWANDVYSVLVVLQALDAAGKDGTIEHVMSGVNPQGCQVYSFKKPSAEELDHNFLWRCSKALPERGRIGIFNRSYYEEVIIVHVHPEILAGQKLPPGKKGKGFWQARYEDINNFEKHLVRNGTMILKFFLNVSRAEQKRRFLARLDDPEKHWKFAVGDVKERKHWPEYMRAYEDMFNATSTPWAPWYVIPADHKMITRALVSSIMAWNIRSLKLAPPKVSGAQRRELAAVREELLAE
jgi:PPK2 family polyphosphate:nucleotide phosphotransferase